MTASLCSLTKVPKRCLSWNTTCFCRQGGGNSCKHCIERGLCCCSSVLCAEKKTSGVGVGPLFIFPTEIPRLFSSSSVRWWFQGWIAEGEEWWLGDDLQTTQHVLMYFLTCYQCLFKCLCGCREPCLQQKGRGGFGSEEEDPSVWMPCEGLGGGMQFLAGLRTRACCFPCRELLAFTPVIAACLEMLLLKAQND